MGSSTLFTVAVPPLPTRNFINCIVETGGAIATWIFEELLCHWGSLCIIVTNNGAPFLCALDILAKWYGICHITILGYNSQAAGAIEWKHYNVCESLIKAADGDASKWSPSAHSMFWEEQITVCHSVGASPYFLAHGVLLTLPGDLKEATYLIPPPESILLTTDLIAQ